MRRPDTTGQPWLRARNELHRRLVGDVLEIGPGVSPTLPTRGTWLGVERSRGRVKHLARRISAGGRGIQATAIAGRAEDLPVPDASVDVVVSTWVLCSVDDQAAALREIRRVLRPGGRFVFCEHVGAEPGTFVHAVQRLAAPISRAVDRGCDPSRQTRRTMESVGFRGTIADYRMSRWTTILVGTVDR